MSVLKSEDVPYQNIILQWCSGYAIDIEGQSSFNHWSRRIVA